MVSIKRLKIKPGPRPGGGGWRRLGRWKEGKKMTDDASLVAMIDSVERLAVRVAGQTVR